MTKPSRVGLSGGDAAHMALVARERAYRQAIAALYYKAGAMAEHFTAAAAGMAHAADGMRRAMEAAL